MPDLSNLVDIAELAQAMGKQYVFVALERCLPVRHRKARCRQCVDVCPAQAVTVKENKVQVDHSQCVGCGACTTVCPAEALVPLDPPDAKLQSDAELLLQHAAEKGLPEGTVCVACARKAARHEADDQAFVEVPCLCRVHESFLVGLVARGATDLALVDADCATCKLGHCEETTNRVVESATKLLEAQGCDARIRRTSHFPQGMPGYRARALSETRRAFFTSSADSGKKAAEKTARFFIRREAQKDTTVAMVLDAFGLTAEQEADLVEPHRRTHLIDALYEVGQPAQETLDSRLFGSVEIDNGKCNICNICTVVCPTKALHRSDKDGKDAPGSALISFWPSDCIQCHLCEDVCFRKCVTVGSEVRLDQLFSFEPAALVKKRPTSAENRQRNRA
ncbi:MAG: 4Fe-4S binding protein [Coriobacteriia bacterium]|nr:4Fe-4S binding protein [Coriobacteriia bacterium]